jgi:hypothetical protein
MGVPQVFELIGEPGSGKTSVAKSVARTSVIVTLPGGTISGTRATGRLRECLRRPVFALALYGCVVLRKGVRLSHLRKLYAVQKAAHAMEPLQSRKVSAIVDEGAIHTLYSALFGSVRTAASGLLLKLVMPILLRSVDVVVFLDTPRQQCVTNFSRRQNSSRFSGKSSRQLIQQFTADRTYDEIVDAVLACKPNALMRFTSRRAATDFLRQAIHSPSAVETAR